MKKWLLFFVFIASINAFSQTTPVLSSPTTEDENTMKLFLSITHNNDAISTAVKNTLNSMGGAIAVAYCDRHALFMVIVSKNSYQDENSFLDQVRKLTPGSERLLSTKQGDFNAFIKDCEPSSSADASRLKNISPN